MPVILHCPEGCKIEINGESKTPDVWCHAHDRQMSKMYLKIPVNEEGPDEKGFE